MKKTGTSLMKNLRYLCLVGVITLGLMTIVGTGGGGGGGGTTTTTPTSETTTTTTTLPATQNYGMILGTVKDISGNSIAGATVTAGDSSATANDDGWFSIAEIAETDRLVVNFTKDGYVMTSQITRVRTGESSYLEVVMAPEGTSQSVSGSTGGTVATTDNGSLTISANTLVDAQGASHTGTASASLTTFDPTNDAQRKAFPGDFEGVDTSGETIPFASYGFMDVAVRDSSGNALDLADGSTANITIPLPTSLRDSAPDTMPLWYFKSTDGKWYQEGTLTKNANGDAYEGTISHFSIWNSDVGYSRSFVSGTVVDCVGQPVQGARVTIKGISPRNCWDSGETSTPADGSFGPLPVDADGTCKIWASKGGVSSDPIEFTALSVNLTKEWGNLELCVNIPLITITLTWGENPRDLDSHLTIPMADGTREHLYFGTPSLSVGDAKLDTDDTTSYGPEVITVYSLHDGVYRYSVHHYAGSGTISTSGASVNLVVDGVGIYNLTPPAGAVGDDDAWRLWDITVQNGAVTNVSPINDYINGVSCSDTEAFSP